MECAQRGSGEVFLYSQHDSPSPQHVCTLAYEQQKLSPVLLYPQTQFVSFAFCSLWQISSAIPLLFPPCFPFKHTHIYIYIPLTFPLLLWRNVCIHVPITPSPCLCSPSFYIVSVFPTSSAGERQAELLHLFKKWVCVGEHTDVHTHALVYRCTPVSRSVWLPGSWKMNWERWA